MGVGARALTFSPSMLYIYQHLILDHQVLVLATCPLRVMKFGQREKSF